MYKITMGINQILLFFVMPQPTIIPMKQNAPKSHHNCTWDALSILTRDSVTTIEAPVDLD
jgi:hypothetical protein